MFRFTFINPFIDKKEFQVLPWKAEQEPREETHRAVRVIRGHEWNWLKDASKNKFLEQSFQISNQSDRMGYILKADALELTCKDELVSSVVNFGTVQLLPDGQLIILMADHQTTGGYPRAAHVIAADHSRLSQMKAGEEISFEMISHKEAEDLLLKQKQHLTQVQNACAFRLEQFMHA